VIARMIFVLILGLCIGSFLNVCIYRIPREESISFPPSHCTSCGYKLKFFDLVPIISYMALKGRCRKCGEKISIKYPFVEIVHGILYLGLYLKFGYTVEFFKYALLISLLLVIGIIDLNTKYVYRSTTITGAIMGTVFLIFNWVTTQQFPIDYVFGATLGFALIYIIVKITGGMGEGDIEIAALCGMFLGVKNIALVLFLSFLFGGIIGIILLLRRRKGRKDEIAFGPYIVLGALVTIFIGDSIIKWYTNFFVV
jgi:leader peptidase (prepilin peptidase)/N-methyltransferase